MPRILAHSYSEAVEKKYSLPSESVNPFLDFINSPTSRSFDAFCRSLSGRETITYDPSKGSGSFSCRVGDVVLTYEERGGSYPPRLTLSKLYGGSLSVQGSDLFCDYDGEGLTCSVSKKEKDIGLTITRDLKVVVSPNFNGKEFFEKMVSRL